MIFLEGHEWYYLTYRWEDKRVHTFPKGICPKGNVIVRLEFELAYYDSTVQGFNHYNFGTPHYIQIITIPLLVLCLIKYDNIKYGLKDAFDSY